MKISELRALLDHTAAEDMKRLVVELYRALPKKTRGSELVQLLVEKLRTPEALELAVERTEQLLRASRSQPDKRIPSVRGIQEVGIVRLSRVRQVVRYDKAIDFFNTHYARGNPEETLFVLLTWLNVLHRKDLWRREYEKAIQAGVKPREGLSTAYHHLCSHG